MKTKFIKRGMSGLMAVLMAVTAFVGLGTTTAFAASETAESYMVSYPRDGDANQVYGEDGWGHTAKTYMNGWSTGSSRVLTLHCMDSYDGKVCYCIEPGVVRNVGDTYTKFNENFWDNYPSNLNNTIEPDTIKLLLGRIMQYGYQGNISTSWRSQDAADADKMAHAAATQLLVWETVVGERDADFNHVSTGGKDTIKSTIGKNNPLYSRINSYYDSMVASVQSHSKIPSFMAKSSGKAKDIELEWTGSEYTATLTDSNGVLSKYTFSANVTGIKFSVSGNKLTITAKDAPADKVSITATKSNTRTGVIVWSDGKHRSSGVQDTVTYSASVSDPVKAFLNIKVSYGSAKIVKTSEDGKVDGIKFTVVGDGVNQTVTTNSKGEIQIDNLKPGVYTVTEQTYDKYVPQETHRVTVLAGQTATVSFNNVLRRGDLTVTKTSEDGLVEGVKFHLYGTSVSGLAVDEFAVTNSKGVATFKDVLIGSGYTLEEVDTAIRYVVPANQSAAVEWNKETNKSFSNILKKFNVTVTKSDKEAGTAQGDASLAASTTERDFLRVMNEMGYEVVTRTQKGTPLVHPIVKIVDGDKRFRLDNLGEYYELDSIKQRIQNNYRRKDPFPEVKEDKKAPYYHYKEKAEKATGLYALYLHYCYELHIIIYKPAFITLPVLLRSASRCLRISMRCTVLRTRKSM